MLGAWVLCSDACGRRASIRSTSCVVSRPEANALAVAEALTFHQAIGGARKEARLMYLRDTWAKRLLAAGPRVRLYTSLRPRVAGNIVMVDVDGIEPMKLWAYLWEKHRI
jgi:selenocysteine lyase/cysteine desulfurase